MLVDHLLKTKKEYKNLKKQEIQDIFPKMNQIKLVFKRAVLDKVLRDKALDIIKNSKYNGYQKGLASMV